eukprot:7223401-Pyramimonas_sp.AAC.1
MRTKATSTRCIVLGGSLERFNECCDLLCRRRHTRAQIRWICWFGPGKAVAEFLCPEMDAAEIAHDTCPVKSTS